MSAVIEKLGEGLKTSGADQIEPRSSQLIRALRQIGYSFEQAISDLIDNSIKYGKYGGAIVASMYNTDDKNILVEISDDGIGISEKNIDRVFERFFRTSEGRGRDVTGSGLGLSISKHIVEAHTHTIHVRSKENIGTTIGFTLSSRKNGL